MKEYNKDKVFDIMEITQNNYSNMLKRLTRKDRFSNFVLVYYSICIIVYSLTTEFFPSSINVKLSSYFNIILSIVVLVYSLINGSAKYSERIHMAEKVLNSVKAKKRDLNDENVDHIRSEYEQIMSKAEYRDEVDFFRTLKQKCKEKNVRWYCYKKDLEKGSDNDKELKSLNNYLSENFPYMQQAKICFEYLGYAFVIIIPIILFVASISIKEIPVLQ